MEPINSAGIYTTSSSRIMAETSQITGQIWRVENRNTQNTTSNTQSIIVLVRVLIIYRERLSF